MLQMSTVEGGPGYVLLSALIRVKCAWYNIQHLNPFGMLLFHGADIIRTVVQVLAPSVSRTFFTVWT